LSIMLTEVLCDTLDLKHKMRNPKWLIVQFVSGGARGHPDEGAAFPDGGAETPRAAAAPPSGVWGGGN